MNDLISGVDTTLLLLGLIVFFSYTTQAITGFGSTVLALTLGAHLYSIQELLPVLVALNLPLCTYFVLKGRSTIDRKILLKGILPWMSLGVVVGLIIIRYLPSDGARTIFGALVFLFALRELIRLLTKNHSAPPLSNKTFSVLVFFSGITHGMYSAGGPLLVYATSRLGLDKKAFRSTLMTVWFVFNFVLIAYFLWAGIWTAAAIRMTVILLPAIPLGIIVGEWLHTRMPLRAFWILVQTILLVSGAAFFIR